MKISSMHRASLRSLARRGALKPTLSEQRCQLLSTTSRSIAHVHAISAFDFSHALRCRRHATSTLVVMGAPAPRRRALGALHRITNVGSEFRCAYGVRRACGSEAGADFDHALSGTGRRRRGIHDRSGDRGHPPPCRDDGLYRCRDVPGAVPGFRVATVPRKRSLPEPANGSTLPTMVGAVIYVRVSTKEQTENLSRRRSFAPARSTAAARATKFSNGSTRKARAPSPRIAASFKTCSRTAG